MQHTFNFTLEKMICLKKHDNSIKIGLFCLYFETKKMRFCCLYFRTEGVDSKRKLKSMYQNDSFMNSNKTLLVFINIFP